MKRIVGIVGALAAAMVMTSCASSSDDGLVVYSGRNEGLVGPVLADFTEETGIELDIRYGGTSGTAAQLIEEGEQTPAAVFLSQDAGALGALRDEGLLASLPQELLDTVPAQYRDSAGTWIAVTGRARVLGYNPDLVAESELPASVYELTQEQWRGRVAIAPANASFQSFVTGMRVTDGDEVTAAWLADLVANDVQTYQNNIQILDALEAGQIDLGLTNHYYWFERAAEIGQDAMVSALAYTEPGDPGSLVNISGVAVMAPAADDPRAQQLVDYLLSEAGQTYFAEETFEYPMIAAVPADDSLVPLAELQGPQIDLSDLSSLPETIEMIQDAGLL